MDSFIPKRIIQTGKTHDLPLLEKAAVANVKLLNPDFEYLYFDNKQVEEFIDVHYPEYRKVFDSFRYPIQRYDFFRYLAVYHFGGFYFDLDVFLAAGLSQLLSFGCVFTFEELSINTYLRQEYGMDWDVGNYAFGAAARHPFLLAIIRNCVRAQTNPEWAHAMMRSIPPMFREARYVLNTTGPGLVSRTLAEYPNAMTQIKVLFPSNVHDSTKWHCFGEYGVHLMAGTWRTRMGFIKRKMADVWQLWIRNSLNKESLILGESRSLEFKRRP